MTLLVFLFFLRSCCGYYINICVACFLLEFDCSVDESIEGMVFTDTYVIARAVNCSALTADNAACLSGLTTKNFNAETFAM